MWYMITAPKNRFPKKIWRILIAKYDIHDGVIALERGKSGYEHWQQRIRVADSNASNLFTTLSQIGAHVEKSGDDCTYERKQGRYVGIGELPDVRKVRFGILCKWQKAVINKLRHQGIREITVVVDRYGGCGKSYLVNYLYENKNALYICPLSKHIQQDVASAWNGERIIVIDIPRSYKWTQELCCGLEMIKDGLIADCRYNYKVKNVRGVKVLVMTNYEPNRAWLSADRWQLIYPARGGRRFLP